MLTTRNVSFTFPNQPRMAFPDIHCQTGEHWLLLGQSGSGKTTLLHLLAGLRTPSTGEINVHGTMINQLSGGALDQWRGHHVGIIFQQAHFVRALTVQENLVLARQLAGLPADSKKIKALLEQLGVLHKLNEYPQALSVGEQQRVAIARALVNEPSVILADEPTSALDDFHTQQVVTLLKTIATQANATLLVVTHDNRLKATFDKQILL
ncbi:MAG: ATP-binding cassette domain-containing protein [Saprospiraceae bacterium]